MRQRRAKSCDVVLTTHDMALIKGMLGRGDRTHDIAAYFGINAGRVSEINSGSRGAGVPTATGDELPPAGPYPSPRQYDARLRQAYQRVSVLLQQLEAAMVDAETIGHRGTE